MSNTVENGRPAWLAPMEDPKSELILRAAFDVFEEHGLHCATMLEVAKRARVSKETLYARFDSKEGLFYALIAWGCRQSAVEHERFAVEPIEDPVAALHDYARAFLTMTMRPESLAVYRMAVAEAGRQPEIGQTFNELGSTNSIAVLERLIKALAARGLIEPTRIDEMAEDFCGLMRGNFQHQALTGSIPIPSQEEIDARAVRVADRWLRAYAPQSHAHAIAAE